MRVSHRGSAVLAFLWIAACGGGDAGIDAAGDDVAAFDSDAPPTEDATGAEAAVPDAKDALADEGAAPDDAGPDGLDQGENPGDESPPPDVEDQGSDAETLPDAEIPQEVAEACVGPECLPPCPDDGLWCTQVHRDETGACATTIAKDACLVGGQCYFALEPDPDNACLSCDPEAAQEAFTSSIGLPCDDGDPCTMGDACDADGSCVPGAPNPCEDGNPCTDDSCDKATGCRHVNNAKKCDDGNACTVNDHCVGGA